MHKHAAENTGEEIGTVQLIMNTPSSIHRPLDTPHPHTCTHTHTQTHTHTHTTTHPHTHTHTHTQTPTGHTHTHKHKCPLDIHTRTHTHGHWTLSPQAFGVHLSYSTCIQPLSPCTIRGIFKH